MKGRTILLRAAAGVVIAAAGTMALLVLSRERGWYEPAAPPGPPMFRLITAEQYLSSVHDIFGDDIHVEVSFPPLQRRQGLVTLGAFNASMTPGALEQFDRAARAIAMQVVDEAHRSTLVPCTPANPQEADDSCARAFFAHIGRFLYRRPLSERELRAQVAIAGTVTRKLGDFYAGLAYRLAGMLTSPQFLYFTDMTEPDPEHPGQIRLSAFSKATRLSLLLWNSTPDDTLLKLAESGELHHRQVLQQQIERLLHSPRLEQGVRAFFSDMLSFDKFDTLTKDPVIYPVFTREVARSAQEQALRQITDHLITHNGDYRDLFTTSHTFVDGTLGGFYQLPTDRIPDNPEDWIPYDTVPGRSAGVLTSLSFVAVNAHPGRSSPTRRGKAIRELLLCQKVPDPPPNVNFSRFEDPHHHFSTARERLQAHATDPVCAGCHKLTDPIGLGLENYDGAGLFRAKEGNASIDAHGTLDGHPFTDVASLGQAVHDHPALTSCLTSRWYAYAVGREVRPADRTWLTYIGRRFALHGYRVPDLLREIASSRAFFAVSAPSSSSSVSRPSSLTAANVQ